MKFKEMFIESEITNENIIDTIKGFFKKPKKALSAKGAKALSASIVFDHINDVLDVAENEDSVNMLKLLKSELEDIGYEIEELDNIQKLGMDKAYKKAMKAINDLIVNK